MALQRINWLQIDTRTVPSSSVIDLGTIEGPIHAIYAEEDVPANQQQFIKLNIELARKWPSITKSKSPLPEAEQWKDTEAKLEFLER